MSMPLEPQQQPPPMTVTEEAYTSHSGHGSIGPVIAVLAVITILGVVAGMIGRLCSGRRIMGHGQFDFEGWIERKCSSCIDGRINPPPPPPPPHDNNGSGDSVPVTIPIETPQETKQTEQPPQNPPATSDS
ncbi:hypothetical protein HHK36_008433 [Tetracentron sinense]|uniref:Uncharacterized protein n=1 Tax=Tetracentron sinense TaxID=13715 RepID=A0A834ZGC8_TETSI|nr:hypothetical protein HHK36_008433 [Tetracentron sinense]